ncbi:hypothetical protein [Halomonas piscis]|nr:hypothetical protein [Halomonas piscis]
MPDFFYPRTDPGAPLPPENSNAGARPALQKVGRNAPRLSG